MRLAGLFLVLTVLAALVRMGGGAEARSLTARAPDAPTPSEGGEAPMRWTEDRLSGLEDLRGGPPRADGPAGSGGGHRTKKTPGPAAGPPAGPPVFYRPAGPGPDAGPVCGDLRGDPEGAGIVFPLERRFFFSYEDTWGAPRAQGGHEGADLMVPAGVPEYAVTDGTVVPVAGSDADGWNALGGHALMIRAEHSVGPVREGDLFYYAHLERKSPLEMGAKVRAGQVVGHAGDTGGGPPGTRGLFPPHLHLGWYDGTGGRGQATSGAMNPYPLLEWIKANGGAVAGGSDARFCEAPRTGPPAPSAHDGAWPASPTPDLSPDLDAGPGKRDVPRKAPTAKKGGGGPRADDRRTGGKPKDLEAPDPADDRGPPKPQTPGRSVPRGLSPSEEQYEPASGGRAAPPDRAPRAAGDPKPAPEGGGGKNGKAGKARHRP